MKLVRLSEYRNRDVVDAARELLELAESGSLEGLVFAVKLGDGDHGAGRAGCYKRHPEQALPAVLLLKEYLTATTGGRLREIA